MKFKKIGKWLTKEKRHPKLVHRVDMGWRILYQHTESKKCSNIRDVIHVQLANMFNFQPNKCLGSKINERKTHLAREKRKIGLVSVPAAYLQTRSSSSRLSPPDMRRTCFSGGIQHDLEKMTIL